MTNEQGPTGTGPSNLDPSLASRDSGAAVVYVVDDDPAIRRLVASVLDANGITVELYDSGAAFLKHHVPGQRGCLLLDVDMPELSGPAIQEILAQRQVELPVVFLTGVADVDTSVAVMKRGAFDLIQKPFQKERLIAVITQALSFSAKQSALRQRQAGARNRYESLNERERQVLKMVVAGLANKQMARKLDLSEKTIEVHRSRTMTKMGADSLAELVRLALDAGVEPDNDQAGAANPP